MFSGERVHEMDNVGGEPRIRPVLLEDGSIDAPEDIVAVAGLSVVVPGGVGWDESSHSLYQC